MHKHLNMWCLQSQNTMNDGCLMCVRSSPEPVHAVRSVIFFLFLNCLGRGYMLNTGTHYKLLSVRHAYLFKHHLFPFVIYSYDRWHFLFPTLSQISSAISQLNTESQITHFCLSNLPYKQKDDFFFSKGIALFCVC